jgi:hypothetical protein
MKALAVLFAAVAMVSLAFPQKMRVKVENEVINFDAMPRQVNGVTMVPIRPMVEAMGGTMKWDLASRTVSVWKGGHRFNVTINSRQATSDDKSVRMEETPAIFENRIFVPLKFIADAGGYMISMEEGWYVLRSTAGKGKG